MAEIGSATYAPAWKLADDHVGRADLPMQRVDKRIRRRTFRPERPKLSLQIPWMPKVVRVDWSDVFATSHCETMVTGCRWAAPFLPNQSDPVILQCDVADSFGSVVRRAVVNDQHFPVCMGLGPNTGDRRFNRAGGVVRWHDDGNAVVIRPQVAFSAPARVISRRPTASACRRLPVVS